MFELSDRVIVITCVDELLSIQHAHGVSLAGRLLVLLDLKAGSIESLAQDLQNQYGVSSDGYAVGIANEKLFDSNVNKVLKRF
jgi:hypothetical protein